MAGGVHDKRYRLLIGRLRERRSALGLSQAALAKDLGQRQQFVSKYESGERRLDVIEFIDVASSLGLDWREVIGGVVTGPIVQALADRGAEA